MKKKISTGIFALFLIVSISIVSAQPSDLIGGDNIYVENDNIAIKITGGQNVPMYSFWDPSQNDTKYEVKFILLFEVIDENQDGVYTPGNDSNVPASVNALPALSWEFSAIETDGNGITHFNITSVGGAYTIQLINHLGSDASLKFDVKIEGYEFVSADENAMLVIGFHLIAVEQGLDETETPQVTQTSNETGSNKKINFGRGAYFESETKANASGKEINAGVSVGSEEGNPLAYIAFERFDGPLYLDPIIGLSESVDSTDNGLDSEGDEESSIFSIPGYASIWFIGLSIAVSGIIYLRKSKNQRKKA